MPERCGASFAQGVPDDGYAWWYVDALSDNGDHGLTLIAFVGSVFSPYYARARRSGPTNPEQHCALNVALYGKGGKRWALTERGRGDLARTDTTFTIGPSSIRFENGVLEFEINEITVPIPRSLKGRVVIRPRALVNRSFVLNEDGSHIWHPIAPVCDVQVVFEKPGLSWTGHGYVDHNRGAVPLEAGFRTWDWSRARTARGTTIFYDGVKRSGEPFHLSLDITTDGVISTRPPPPPSPLAMGAVWRMPRQTRSDAKTAARVVATFEDTPFYTRSKIALNLDGTEVPAVHESLSLDRFSTRWVQSLLHFRMPRIATP